jgi:hypothetical protein
VKRIIAIIMAASLLSACSLTGNSLSKVDRQQIIVADIPTTFYNCKLPPPPPNPETLTNRQVVNYTNTLYKRLVECNINMDKIKKYVDSYKKNLENKQRK